MSVGEILPFGLGILLFGPGNLLLWKLLTWMDKYANTITR